MRKNISTKLVKVLYTFAVFMANVAVNTTCYHRYYQEELNPQLDSLRKYHDK